MHKNENQHYVPQFLLRNFTVLGKPNQIFVFDKQTGRSFPTNIKNVASEKGFYDFVSQNYSLTLEPSLSKLESFASVVIAQIIDKESLAVLTTEDRILLSHFMAVQFVRVKGHFARLKHAQEQLFRLLESRPHLAQKALDEIEEARNLFKFGYLKSITRSKDYVPLFMQKIWVLHKTTTARPFYISDCPVTLYNTSTFGRYGNVGLGVRGIEVYLPLSKTLMLGFWCPTLDEKARKTHEEVQSNLELLKKIKESGVQFPQMAMATAEMLGAATLAFTGDMQDRIEKGIPLICSVDNTTYLNHLQVLYAERHVMSSRDEFSLVKQMIADDEVYRSGPRMNVR